MYIILLLIIMYIILLLIYYVYEKIIQIIVRLRDLVANESACCHLCIKIPIQRSTTKYMINGNFCQQFNEAQQIPEILRRNMRRPC